MFDSSAQSSMLGYFYQPFFALQILMSKDVAECDNAQIYIENIDDIDFQMGNNHLTLYQNKHHINRQGSISDKSEDLWKTLRIWSERIKNNEIDINNTSFFLTTTVNASANSIASKLSINKSTRNTQEALEEFIRISKEGVENKNKRLSDENIRKHVNEDYYESFYSLDLQLKTKLVQNIYILDNQPEIENVQNNIKQILRFSARREQINYFYEKLIGWWFSRVINNLIEDTKIPITYNELHEKISDISDEFKKDSLPIDYEFDFSDVTAEYLSPNQKNFIKQLNLILVNDNEIANAVLDYYRAYMQRSKWMQEGKLYISDLSQYEQRLIREWEQVKSKFENTRTIISEKDKIELGKDIYFQVGDLKLPICSSGVHSNRGFYIMRGSYHILSNSLKIGWHPEYIQRLSLNERQEEVLEMEVEN